MRKHPMCERFMCGGPMCGHPMTKRLVCDRPMRGHPMCKRPATDGPSHVVFHREIRLKHDAKVTNNSHEASQGAADIELPGVNNVICSGWQRLDMDKILLATICRSLWVKLSGMLVYLVRCRSLSHRAQLRAFGV